MVLKRVKAGALGLALALAMTSIAAEPTEAASGRRGAAAVGAIAGAAIALGVLGAAANAATGPVYVEPEPVIVPQGYTGQAYYGYVRQNPTVGVEACRRGILRAARPYGAYDARVQNVYDMRITEYGAQKFRAVITVFYPDAPRTSTVVCSTDNGYLTGARAER